MAAILAAASIVAPAAGPRGTTATARAADAPEAEVPYLVAPLKITGARHPVYVQGEGRGKLVFSDASGAIYSVSISGGRAKLIAKVEHPAGLAVAPAGFGSYAGEIFVLSARGKKGLCEVDRIEKSGKVSAFAKLPDAGKIDGGKPTGCRDLEFAPPSSPFKDKLYAVANGNATVYEIAPNAKARAFATLDKPVPFEILNLGFTAPNDPKAANKMLLGMRPRAEVAAKVGRIGILGPDGKLGRDYYLVGFTRPTGWAYAPRGFGEYSGAFFIADAGWASKKNHGARDGAVMRLYKGVAREFAKGMVDPNCLKVVGNAMVMADPGAKGRHGGEILVLKSML